MKPLSEEGQYALLWLAVLFVCAVLFEVSILAIAFFGTDRVECNLLWCTFTTERGTSQVIESRSCFMNGDSVPCGTFGAEGYSRVTDNGSLCFNEGTWGCE